MELLNKIISVTAFKSSDKSTVSFKPLAKWLLNDVKVSEEEFVLALAYLRDHHPNFYRRIDIPKKWDGGAHREFPELFISGDTVALTALREMSIVVDEDGKDFGPFKVGDHFTVSSKCAVPLVKRGMADIYYKDKIV